MSLRVFPTWQIINSSEIKGDVVIVIDVLRASNTIITALANGATKIIPVPTIADAQKIQRQFPNYLLAGERNAQKIIGFDLGNSPLEFTRKKVKDQSIVLTTTNGCQALFKAVIATKIIYVASLANSKAIATKIDPNSEKISIICAGTRGYPALEDSLAAGKIIVEMLVRQKSYSLNDFAHLCLNTYLQNKRNIQTTIALGINGQNLKNLGLTQDLDYCSQVDTTDIIPIFNLSEKCLISLKI